MCILSITARACIMHLRVINLMLIIQHVILLRKTRYVRCFHSYKNILYEVRLLSCHELSFCVFGFIICFRLIMETLQMKINTYLITGYCSLCIIRMCAGIYKTATVLSVLKIRFNTIT